MVSDNTALPSPNKYTQVVFEYTQVIALFSTQHNDCQEILRELLHRGFIVSHLTEEAIKALGHPLRWVIELRVPVIFFPSDHFNSSSQLTDMLNKLIESKITTGLPRILPVLTNGTASLPVIMSDITYADLTPGRADRERQLERLVQSLRR